MTTRLVDIDAEERHHTEKAWMVFTGITHPINGSETWIALPKSLVENNEDGTFTMPEWLAIEKNLV